MSGSSPLCPVAPSSCQLTHPWPSSFTADILFLFYCKFPPLVRGFTRTDAPFPESWLLDSNNLLDLNISQYFFFFYLAFQFACCMTSLNRKLAVNIPVVLNLWILLSFSFILCFSFFFPLIFFLPSVGFKQFTNY